MELFYIQFFVLKELLPFARMQDIPGIGSDERKLSIELIDFSDCSQHDKTDK
jgi:hypothetical protein